MTVQDVSPQKAYEWLSSGKAFLIDVREPDEFSDEHIVYAASLPLGDVYDRFSLMRLPPGSRLIFHCHKGGRARRACDIASPEDSALYDVYNLEGGIEGWKEAGLPVVNAGGKACDIPIFRQVQMIAGALVFLFIVMGIGGWQTGFTLAAVCGGLLFFSALTGWCGLALALARMPWNRVRT